MTRIIRRSYAISTATLFFDALDIITLEKSTKRRLFLLQTTIFYWASCFPGFFMLLYATLLLLRSLLHTAVLVGVPSILEACFFEICFALRVRKQANRPGVLFFAKKDKKPTRGNESRRCFYSTIKYYFLHYESAFKRPCCQHIWKTCIENPKSHAVTMVEKLLQKSHFTKWF